MFTLMSAKESKRKQHGKAITIRARQAAAGILRQFTGREIRLLADLHRKKGNKYFAPLIIPNLNSNQILALRQSSVLAGIKVLHYMGSLPYLHDRPSLPISRLYFLPMWLHAF